MGIPCVPGEARRRERLGEKRARQKEAAAAAEGAAERRRQAEEARRAELEERARRREQAQVRGLRYVQGVQKTSLLMPCARVGRTLDHGIKACPRCVK